MSAHPATLRQFFEPAPINHARLKQIVQRRSGKPAAAVGRSRAEVALVLQDSLLEAFQSALDMSFSDVVSRGWLALNEVRDAAQLSATGRGYAVPLGRHKLRSEHTPSLEVFHGEQLVGVLSARAVVELKIESIELLVCEGAITGLRRGDYFGSGSLQIEGAGIATLEARAFSLPDEARLRAPLKVPY